MAKLEVSIKKRLGEFQLDVELVAEDGILALLGASGSGKSMTLKCIAGIETPDEGRIVLDGRVLFDSKKRINIPPRKRGVGYLFQSYALFPRMTVRQNIMIGIHGSRAEKFAQAEEKIDAFYLRGLEDKLPGQLSGGQQQRVALARILASAPSMILLDEPFSALDSYLQWRLEAELLDTLRDFGGIALYVSHSRDEVFRICDRVCVISDGASEPVVAVRELFANPQTLSACLLSGCKNYSRIERLDGSRFRAIDWNIELSSGREVPADVQYVGIRSHSVRLAEADGENVLECDVLRVTEELFGVAILLRPVTATEKTDFSQIRLELPKEQWITGKSTVKIAMSAEDLLLLR